MLTTLDQFVVSSDQWPLSPMSSDLWSDWSDDPGRLAADFSLCVLFW